jgi:branched-subunit amino acid permease
MFLGAQYHDAIKNVGPESMLAAIAQQALGGYGMPIVSITFAVSCLATATVLAALFVDFLKEDITGGRLSRPLAIVATMGVTFGLSLLGFQSIRIVLGTVLTWIYPFLVLYTVVSIILKLRRREG